MITNHPNSSAVRQVDYDPATSEMTVTLAHGAKYTYPNTTSEQHNAFVSADSVGRHFASVVSKRQHTR